MLKQGKFVPSGWPFGVCCALFTAFCALVLNLSVTIAFSTRYGSKDGLGILYEGDCAAVDRVSTWLHLAINIIGSLLLAASNYCMQCLAAPTRADCDRAHAKNDWLDIGILSVRNVLKLGGWRSAILLVLALSSLPIHLIYNSTVIKTVTASYYHAFVVDDGFLRGDPVMFVDSYGYFPQRFLDVQESWLVNASSFSNLSKTECVDQFATDYVSAYSNLLLVTEASNDSWGHVYGTLHGPGLPFDGARDPFLRGYNYLDTGVDPLDISQRSSTASYDWLCPSATPHCSTTSLRANASNLAVSGQRISYCLAEQAPPHCQVQFSTDLLITIIVCNAIKVVAMLATLYVPTRSALVVLGDALESFLLRPDHTTAHVTTLSAKDAYDPSTASLRSTWTASSRPKRWLGAVRSSQWGAFTCVALLALIATAILFSMAMSGASSEYARQPALSIPLGTSTPATIIISLFEGKSDTEATTAAVLLGNPQLVMSFAYVLFNNIFTSMLLAHEWSTYATRRKPLRVTRPHDDQISTYWLQLPFVYGISLLAISAAMHWLISQALFMIRLQTRRIGFVSNSWVTSIETPTYRYDDEVVSLWPPAPLIYNGSEFVTADTHTSFSPNHTHPLSIFQDDVRSSRSALAYSPVAILCALAVGSFLCFGIFVFGALRKFKSNMPIAASCSLAIAAACHALDTDVECSSRALKWTELDGSTPETPIYSFTTFEDRATLANTVMKT